MADKIEKVAENHVIFFPEIEIEDTDGKTVKIYDKIKEYGQQAINDEMTGLNNEMTRLDNLDINAAKEAIQAKLDKLTLIQTVMDGDIGAE